MSFVITRLLFIYLFIHFNLPFIIKAHPNAFPNLVLYLFVIMVDIVIRIIWSSNSILLHILVVIGLHPSDYIIGIILAVFCVRVCFLRVMVLFFWILIIL